MSRDKTCEARGCGAYQSGIEGCHDEWFHREARIARLCMMFMQDGDGVRSVRKVASARYRLRAPTSEPAARQWLVGSVSASSIEPCRLGRPWTEGAAAIGTAPAVCEKPTTFNRFDPPRGGPRQIRAAVGLMVRYDCSGATPLSI